MVYIINLTSSKSVILKVIRIPFSFQKPQLDHNLDHITISVIFFVPHSYGGIKETEHGTRAFASLSTTLNVFPRKGVLKNAPFTIGCQGLFNRFSMSVTVSEV